MATLTRAYSLLLIFIFVTSVVLIPWPAIVAEIYGGEFVDRSVYKHHFIEEIYEPESLSSSGLLTYVLDEALWEWTIRKLVGDGGIDIDLVFYTISIFLLATFSAIVLRLRQPLALFLLINPLVIDLAFSQLRLALAISFAGLAYLIKSTHKVAAIAIAAIAPFIHTVTVIFLGIHLAQAWINKLAARKRHETLWRVSALALLGVIISLSIGPLRYWLLSWLGDRRAAYSDMSSSAAYSSFWIILFFSILAQKKNMLRGDFQRYSFVILAIVATNTLHGGYSTRFLAASFPFLLLTLFSFPGLYGIFLLIVFIVYASLQWLYWFLII